MLIRLTGHFEGPGSTHGVGTFYRKSELSFFLFFLLLTTFKKSF